MDIGWSELLVLAVVALLVVGPKELPALMRTIGTYLHKLKETASGFQRQFQTALDESEVGELKSSIDEISSSLAPDEIMANITGERPYLDEFNEDEWDAAALSGVERSGSSGPLDGNIAARDVEGGCVRDEEFDGELDSKASGDAPNLASEGEGDVASKDDVKRNEGGGGKKS